MRIDISESLFRQPRYAIAISSCVVGGILLLLGKELGFYVRRFLISSIFMYSMGEFLIATLHRHFALVHETPRKVKTTRLPDNRIIDEYREINNEKTIPLCWRKMIWALHILWFIAFVIYNFWKGVL